MRIMACLSLSILVAYAAGCRPSGPKAPPWVYLNPLGEVERGEWVVYEQKDGNTLQLEVVNVVNPKGIVTVNERIRTGQEEAPIAAASQKRLTRNHITNGYQSAGWIVARIYEETITLEVDGSRWKCMCFEYLTRTHGVVKVWYSHEFPVYGMLRQSVLKPSGQVERNVEILDWSGRQEGQ